MDWNMTEKHYFSVNNEAPWCIIYIQIGRSVAASRISSALQALEAIAFRQAPPVRRTLSRRLDSRAPPTRSPPTIEFIAALLSRLLDAAPTSRRVPRRTRCVGNNVRIILFNSCRETELIELARKSKCSYRQE